MGKLVVLLMFLTFTNSYASCSGEYLDKYSSLSDTQRHILMSGYKYGEGDDLGYTLAAILLTESTAGKYRLNYLSNDFGVAMINIKTASSILGITNYYKKTLLAQRLIYDDNLSFYLAIDVLKHFREARKESPKPYKAMIMSYNEGNKWLRDPTSREKAEKYYEKYLENFYTVRYCMFVY